MRQRILLKNVAESELENYVIDLKNEELRETSIRKYTADIRQWLSNCDEEISKESIQSYKENMCNKYKATSVNSKIISINRYLKWLGYSELRVKTKRIQNMSSLDNIITREYYVKMLDYATSHNKIKMYHIMKTIAQTGIRIGELKFVTVEAIKRGSAVVNNKGKFRTIYFVETLCQKLMKYCMDNNITEGVIFRGRKNGEPITPGAVWKGLKYIAKQAGVPENLVYPHSFRHLFAREYMKNNGDISELADLLGHTRLETTWIYTKTTCDEKRARLENLNSHLRYFKGFNNCYILL